VDAVGLPLSWGIIPTQRFHRTIKVANPAVGTDWSLVVPGGVVWEILCGTSTLTADATVINRRVVLTIDDGQTAVWTIEDEQAITNGVASVHSFYPTGAIQGIAQPAGFQVMPYPRRLFYAGDRFRVATTNLQAGDQWSAVAFDVLEYQVRGLEEAIARYSQALASIGATG
jgi:hypothetical protein